MTDIALTWDPAAGQADWTILNGDVQGGSDLEASILVSLFTDARASADFVPFDGTGEKRGFWADTYAENPGDQTGSRLWQYTERAKKGGAGQVLIAVRDAACDALQWLIDDQVAIGVQVTPLWLDRITIGLRILIAQPDGSLATFAYAWAWNGI